MKKKNSWLVFVLLALAAVFIINSCDVYNPITDDWWVGEEPGPDPNPDPGPGTDPGTGADPGTGYNPAPSGGGGWPSGGGGGGTIPTAEALDSYTITFNSNDGTYRDLVNTPADANPWPQDIAPGMKASEPGLVNGPAGKEFLTGWYTTEAAADDPANASPTDKWDFNTPPSGNMTLYAGWTSTGKTITFDPNRNLPITVGYPTGATLAFTNCTYTPLAEKISEDSFLTEPKQFGIKTDDPLATSYYFDGWYTDGNGDGDIDDASDTKWNFGTDTANDIVDGNDGNADENITLYAKWSIKDGQVVHTVTFDSGGANGGAYAVPPAQHIGDGQPVSEPNALTKTDYVFEGWFTDGSATPYDFTQGVTGDLTLHARWKLKPYSDTWFNDNGYHIVVPYTGGGSGKFYYPFQYDAGESAILDVSDPAEDATNTVNQVDIVNYLKDHSDAVALIKGYGDTSADTDAFIKAREQDMFYALYEDTGISADRLIKYADFNNGAGPVGADGDEVRVFIYSK